MHWLIGALVSPELLSEAMQPFDTTCGGAAPFFYNLRPKGATTTLGLQGRQT